jgi:hypothetical protein
MVLTYKSGQTQANRGQKTRSKNFLSQHPDKLRQSIDKFSCKHLYVSLLRFYYVSLPAKKDSHCQHAGQFLCLDRQGKEQKDVQRLRHRRIGSDKRRSVELFRIVSQ